MNRLAVVVLNWNGIDDTLDCFNSLLKQSMSDFKIIIVDNGSKDNSVGILKKLELKHKNNLVVLYNTYNKGFDGGVNTGISWALKNKFEYITLLNNDALADTRWLENLVSGFNKKDIGMVTGLLLHIDGKTIDSTGDWYSSWGLPFPRNRNDKASLAPDGGLVFGVSGGATMFKASLFKDIGLFDEDFFAYYEDNDISFRAQLAGWKVLYIPSAIAYHKQGATSSKIPGFAVYQTFKNLPLLFIKNVPLGLILPIGIRFYFSYYLMFFNAFKHKNAMVATKGLIMSLYFTPKKIVQRWSIQKNKRVTTAYIKSILWDDLPPDQTGLRKFRKFFTRN